MLGLYSRTNDPERICDCITNHSDIKRGENISDKFGISKPIGLFEGFFCFIKQGKVERMESRDADCSNAISYLQVNKMGYRLTENLYKDLLCPRL